MIGGFIKGNKIKIDSISLFLMLILTFFIKVILVQWSYNRIFPLLRYNMTGNNVKDFRPLTFVESIVGTLRPKRYEQSRIEILQHEEYIEVRSSRIGRVLLCHIEIPEYQLIWSNGCPNQEHVNPKTCGEPFWV